MSTEWEPREEEDEWFVAGLEQALASFTVPTVAVSARDAKCWVGQRTDVEGAKSRGRATCVYLVKRAGSGSWRVWRKPLLVSMSPTVTLAQTDARLSTGSEDECHGANGGVAVCIDEGGCVEQSTQALLMRMVTDAET